MNKSKTTITKARNWPRIFIVAITLIILLGVGSVVVVRTYYNNNLKPVSGNQKLLIVEIPLGSSVKAVAKLLKMDGLIRSEWAFELYIHDHNLGNSIQAGTYALRPSQSVAEIISDITQGKVKTDLVTIIPGSRIDEVRKVFVEDGFKGSDVEKSLNPSLYKNHPALVDKPTDANLEGYLYPESFQKTDTTKPQDLITKFLDEMQKHLTPEIRNGFVAQGLTVHQGITVASIIEQEVSNTADKAQVAQVFLKRLRSNIALESDPTIIYGAIISGQPPSLTYDSVYNTYKHAGLPPGPIGNVSESSLQAAAHPADTDWLYFVSGDDGVTYFSRTLAEHQALTAQHCKKLCN